MAPIPITRAEYEAKFGAGASSSAPIPISRADYAAKFSQPSYEGPTLFSDPIGALTSADWWLTRPSGERISAGQAIAGPLMQTVPFADEVVAGGGAIGDAILGGPGYDARLAEARAIDQSFDKANPVASTGLNILSLLKAPVGSLGSWISKSLPAAETVKGSLARTGAIASALGLEGAAYGFGTGFGEGEGGLENRLNNALSTADTSAKASAVLGPIALKISDALGAMADKAPQWADDMRFRALGGQPGDLTKSVRRGGISRVKAEADETTTSIERAMKQLAQDGLLDGAKDAKALYNKHALQRNKLGGDLWGYIEQADEALKGKKVYPTKFKNAREYIATEVADDDVERLTAELDGYIDSIKTRGDGSIGHLQDQKEILYGKVYPDGSKARVGLDRAIAKDLKEAIEFQTNRLLPKEAAGAVKTTNLKLAPYEETLGIFERELAKGAGADVFDKFLNFTKTTGGYGAPMLAGTLLGGPAGFAGGAAVGKAIDYLRTPAGHGRMARTLDSFAAKYPKLPSVLPKVPRVAGELSGVEGGTRAKGNLPIGQVPSKLSRSRDSFSNSTTQVIDKAMDIVDEKMAQPVVISAERKKSEDFVAKEEGGQKLKAYYPRVKGSGVTVGTGVDLGNRTEYELKHLGLDEDLIKKLKPYLGKKDGLATKILERAPLRLSKDEANSLDKAVKDDINKRVDTKFEKAAGVELTSLPKEAQTVVRSLSYNFGANLDDALPTIWKAIVSKDWGKVQKLLQTTKWKQPELKDRRLREAALLNNLVRSA